MQVLAVVAPTVVEYVPAPQLEHVLPPMVAEYWPASQAVHVPPSGLMKPRLHVQLVEPRHTPQSSSASLPAGEKSSTGQAVHNPLPRSGL